MMQARTISQLKAIMRGKDAGAFENLIKETNLLRTLGEYDFINYPLILNCFAKFNYVRKDVSEYLIKNTLLKLKDKKDDKTIKARAGLGFEGYSVIIRALSRCPYNEELWNLLEYQIFCTLPKVLEKFDQNSSFELGIFNLGNKIYNFFKSFNNVVFCISQSSFRKILGNNERNNKCKN